jgi:hypothetical protein
MIDSKFPNIRDDHFDLFFRILKESGARRHIDLYPIVFIKSHNKIIMIHQSINKLSVGEQIHKRKKE